MDADAKADLLIPVGLLGEFSAPAVAVTDGSGDPEWVTLPCIGRYQYGPAPALNMPLDHHTAATAREWIEYRRRSKTFVTPATILLLVAAFAVLVMADHWGDAAYITGLVMLVVATAAKLWRLREESRLVRPVFPRLSGGAIRIGQVPIAVCRQWVDRYPEISTI
jgi:hypothetical protein